MIQVSEVGCSICSSPFFAVYEDILTPPRPKGTPPRKGRVQEGSGWRDSSKTILFFFKVDSRIITPNRLAVRIFFLSLFRECTLHSLLYRCKTTHVSHPLNRQRARPLVATEGTQEFNEFNELLKVFIYFTKGRKRPSNFTNCQRSQNSFNSLHL